MTNAVAVELFEEHFTFPLPLHSEWGELSHGEGWVLEERFVEREKGEVEGPLLWEARLKVFPCGVLLSTGSGAAENCSEVGVLEENVVEAKVEVRTERVLFCMG